MISTQPESKQRWLTGQIGGQIVMGTELGMMDAYLQGRDRGMGEQTRIAFYRSLCVSYVVASLVSWDPETRADTSGVLTPIASLEYARVASSSIMADHRPVRTGPAERERSVYIRVKTQLMRVSTTPLLSERQ